MKALLEVLKASTDYLSKSGVSDARRQAEELVSDALGMSRMQLYLEHERPITEKELNKCREWLKRKGKREPLQYIKGEVSFFDCRLSLNRNVLIPRQETELLVDLIAKDLEKKNLEGKTLLDLCTGSGCIGIALKKRFPILNVILSDVCPQALAVAKENARLNQVNVEILQGDFLTPFSGRKTHFLVCNPPYITDEAYEELEPEVKEYEPKLALVGGFSFYERLSKQLLNHLHPEGKMWLEIGFDQEEGVKKLFSQGKSIVQADLAGHPRFFSLEIE